MKFLRDLIVSACHALIYLALTVLGIGWLLS